LPVIGSGSDIRSALPIALFCDLLLLSLAVVTVCLVIASADWKHHVPLRTELTDLDTFSGGIGNAALPRIRITPKALVAANTAETSAYLADARRPSCCSSNTSNEKARGKNELSCKHQPLRCNVELFLSLLLLATSDEYRD